MASPHRSPPPDAGESTLRQPAELLENPPTARRSAADKPPVAPPSNLRISPWMPPPARRRQENLPVAPEKPSPAPRLPENQPEKPSLAPRLPENLPEKPSPAPRLLENPPMEPSSLENPPVKPHVSWRSPENKSPLALPAPPALAANRLSREENPAALSVAADVEGGGEKGSRVVKEIVQRDRRTAGLRLAAAGVRIMAAAVAMIAFSVMVSDRTDGWAGDSFDRYAEYRYLVTVNVIVFVYSLFQVYSRVHRRIMKRHIIRRPFLYYFDFSMDQILAYLLMSASSSAATRNDDWVSTFGRDKFTDQASAAIAMSFLTFFALALSSIISADFLFGKSP